MVLRKTWRWGAPVAVVAAIGAGVGINGALSADASPTLPHKSAKQLLVEVEQAKPVKLSGTVVQHADMGFPALPEVSGESSNLTSLVSGSHTLRVWYGGDDKARIALVGTLGESDVIRNGKDVWIWSSQKNEADHLRLNAGHAKPGATVPDEAADLTPQELAERVLAAIDPTTAVKSDGTVSVAGRDAYQVSVSPRSDNSTIGSIRIAIDARTSAPLRVEVFGRDNANDPAMDAGFTYIDYGAPSDSQFRFDPPAGVKVKQLGVPKKPTARPGKAEDFSVVGKGWTAVLVAKNVKLPRSQMGEYMKVLTPVSGTWGSGRLFQSALFNALLTDDGRLIAGAVTPQVLYDTAGK